MNLYSVMFTSCESGGFFSHEFTSFNHGGVCCVNPPLTQNIWDPEILVFTVILFSIMHPPPQSFKRLAIGWVSPKWWNIFLSVNIQSYSSMDGNSCQLWSNNKQPTWWFQPSWNESKWIMSPSRGKHKKCLKPPTRQCLTRKKRSIK